MTDTSAPVSTPVLEKARRALNDIITLTASWRSADPTTSSLAEIAEGLGVASAILNDLTDPPPSPYAFLEKYLPALEEAIWCLDFTNRLISRVEVTDNPELTEQLRDWAGGTAVQDDVRALISLVQFHSRPVPPLTPATDYSKGLN